MLSLSRKPTIKTNKGISGSAEMESVRDCDLVVEAVFEDMDTKKAIFKRLDAICKPV